MSAPLELTNNLARSAAAYDETEAGRKTMPVPKEDAGGPSTHQRVGKTEQSLRVLKTHKDWRGCIAFNSFANAIVLVKRPPSGCSPKFAAGDQISDMDVTRIKAWFERECALNLSTEALWECIRVVAEDNVFHPVQRYLRGLTWDQQPRVETWLETYCGVRAERDEQQRLIRAVAKRWLISCVARVEKPGCQVDTMLILEGGQGVGKSRILEALAGSQFFGNTPLDLGSKDAFQNIQGVWIYELAELDALLRAESSQAKAFLSAPRDRFRPPYARVPVDIPRSVVFCGTVNHAEYLKDLSGNRRYWPVRCHEAIDRAGLIAARDLLWAEAHALYVQGEQWHLTPEEEQLMREEQADREPEDLWEQAIQHFLAESVSDSFTLSEVWDGIRPLLAGDQHARYNAQRLGSLLARLGWEKARVHRVGTRVRCYVRKDTGKAAAPLPQE